MLKQNYCGLAIMRLQPLHFGHIQILNRMMDECRIPILAIGSAQESRTYGNPFTFQERYRMVKNYPGMGRLNIIPLKDIFNLGAWARYALDTAEKKFHTKINIYYCGADQDAVLFIKEGVKVALSDRGTGIYKGLSATKIRNWILTGQSDWKTYVPTMNHKLIEKVYKGERPRI